MQYDEQEVIEDMVVRYYSNLLTPFERDVYGAFWLRRRTQIQTSHPESERDTRRIWGTLDNPQIEAILERAYDEFIRKAVARVMREDADKLFLNKCPKCQRVARTPKAKQCRWYLHDWHESPVSGQ